MKTFPDFYAFRSSGSHLGAMEALRLGMGRVGPHVGHTVLPGGWQGYSCSAEINLLGQRIGKLAWGGEAQRGWVYTGLSGQGCAYVDSWEFFEACTQALPGFDYRRVDLALDIIDGSCTHEASVAAYRDGRFKPLRGVNPRAKRVEAENKADGSTLYVGSRKSPRFFRGYDKGAEVRAKLGDPSLTHLGDRPLDSWYRLEVELKAAAGVVLPLDLVTRRDDYFAGAYPYLADVLSSAVPARLPQAPLRAPCVDLQASLAQCKRMFGSAIFTAYLANGGDMDAVWAQIVGEAVNERLASSGALVASRIPW